jgi:hypothetical protein
VAHTLVEVLTRAYCLIIGRPKAYGGRKYE